MLVFPEEPVCNLQGISAALLGEASFSQVEGVKEPRSPNSRATDEDVNHEDTEEALGVRDILNFYRSNNEDDHDDLDREIESRILESRERNEIDQSEKNILGPDDTVLSQKSDPLMALEDNIVTAAL